MNTDLNDIESNSLESKNIEQLLAKADELLGQINSDVISEMKEEQRIQLEIHARNLEKIKSDLHAGTEEKKKSATGSGAEGMHEAILDIVKAARDLSRFIS